MHFYPKIGRIPKLCNAFSFLDDLQYAELIATQPGRSAYIDESGGFGFDFTKEGTSAYYVVCSVVVDDKDIPAIEQKVLEMRNTMFGGKEMKSSSMDEATAKRLDVETGILDMDEYATRLKK